MNTITNTNIKTTEAGEIGDGIASDASAQTAIKDASGNGREVAAIELGDIDGLRLAGAVGAGVVCHYSTGFISAFELCVKNVMLRLLECGTGLDFSEAQSQNGESGIGNGSSEVSAASYQELAVDYVKRVGRSWHNDVENGVREMLCSITNSSEERISALASDLVNRRGLFNGFTLAALWDECVLDVSLIVSKLIATSGIQTRSTATASAE